MKRSDMLKVSPKNFMEFMDDKDKVELLREMLSGEAARKTNKLADSHQRKLTHYERTRAQVYATGNKWAIENFEATHN